MTAVDVLDYDELRCRFCDFRGGTAEEVAGHEVARHAREIWQTEIEYTEAMPEHEGNPDCDHEYRCLVRDDGLLVFLCRRCDRSMVAGPEPDLEGEEEP